MKYQIKSSVNNQNEIKVFNTKPTSYNKEIINTDAEKYGGSGAGNGVITPDEQGYHGKPFSACLTIPPLATLILIPE